MLGMSAKELSAIEKTIECLQDIIFKGANIPDHKRSVHRSVLTNTISTHPKILVEGKNLVEFQACMKENRYGDDIISKVGEYIYEAQKSAETSVIFVPDFLRSDSWGWFTGCKQVPQHNRRHFKLDRKVELSSEGNASTHKAQYL